MGEFGFGQSLILRIYFELGNINRKPLSDNNEIWTKKMNEFRFWQCVRKLPKT